MPSKSRGPTRTLSGGRVSQRGTSGYTNWTSQNQFDTGYEWNNSVSSPGPPYRQENNWDKYSRLEIPTRVSGETAYTGSYSQYKYERWITHTNYADQKYAMGSVSVQHWVNKALSSLNTSKGVINLPNAIWELRDFPGMLRDLGRVLSKSVKASDVPGGHLAYTFGWAPLMSDLAVLMDFGAQIESEYRRLEKADDRNQMSGTLADIDTEWGQYSTWNAHYPSQASLYLHQRSVGRRRVWFSARLDRAFTLPDLSNPWGAALWGLGFGGPATNLWNSIPWSFLVDYFIDISSMLEANQGPLPYRPKTICIMVHDSVVRRWDLVSHKNWVTPPTVEQGPQTYDYKRRFVVHNPKAGFAFRPNPFTGKLGILASLSLATALRSIRN